MAKKLYATGADRTRGAGAIALRMFANTPTDEIYIILFAVVIQAILDACAPRIKPVRRYDALHFLESQNGAAFCAALGLDAAYIRQQVPEKYWSDFETWRRTQTPEAKKERQRAHALAWYHRKRAAQQTLQLTNDL